MRMRQVRLPLAAALLLAAVAGCAHEGPAVDASRSTIGVAIYKASDTFMSWESGAIVKAAKDKANVKIVDSENSQSVQNDNIDQFIAQRVDALAINPVDRTMAGVLIDKAKAANIPVIFMNREPLPDDMKKWDRVYYVGAKAEESGTMEGQLIADYWKSHPEADRNMDSVLQYVMLQGEPGHQDAQLRTKYAIQAIEDAGIRVEKVAQDTALWERLKAQEKMTEFLASSGDRIEAVLANNDDMALGAIDALKAAGYFKKGKYMPVVGVDATAPARSALKAGTLLGTVLNDAESQGIATFNLAHVLARGEQPTKANIGFDITDGKYIWISYKKITISNLAEVN
jgi:methyl-galactoside transport system substrate-binding protein